MVGGNAVAVVGLGAMGSRVARRLLSQGHEVIVWNRTRRNVEQLVAAGATAAETPADAARGADVVITMVADPPALLAVTEGARGILAGALPGTTLVEMSTVGPAAVARLASLLPGGVGLLDAPVLGSLTEAESGSLTIFVGGPDRLVERWTPLLEAVGSPVHVGPAGAGAAAKLVANSVLFGVLGVLGEALALADGLALEPEAAFAVLAATPLSAQAERRRASIESGEYPVRFRLALARKDAELIAEAAAAAHVALPVADAQRHRLLEADRAGWGARDYSALLSWIVGAAGVEA